MVIINNIIKQKMCISTKRYAHLNLLLSFFEKYYNRIGLKFYYGGFELTHETNQEKRKHPSFFDDACGLYSYCAYS